MNVQVLANHVTDIHHFLDALRLDKAFLFYNENNFP